MPAVRRHLHLERLRAAEVGRRPKPDDPTSFSRRDREAARNCKRIAPKGQRFNTVRDFAASRSIDLRIHGRAYGTTVIRAMEYARGIAEK